MRKEIDNYVSRRQTFFFHSNVVWPSADMADTIISRRQTKPSADRKRKLKCGEEKGGK